MTLLGHIVWLRGIDPNTTFCAPAYRVHQLLELSTDSRCEDDEYRRAHERVETFLKELGGAMVVVEPFGIVVGEFWVGPLLITERQYSLLFERWV